MTTETEAIREKGAGGEDEEAYRDARRRGAEWCRQMTMEWPARPRMKAAALMGYAHGLEDYAYELKSRANREEEADFARLMAL